MYINPSKFLKKNFKFSDTHEVYHVHHIFGVECICVLISTLRTIRAVEDGAELFISYVDVCISPKAKRCQRLRDQYKFDCSCERCTREDEYLDDVDNGDGVVFRSDT